MFHLRRKRKSFVFSESYQEPKRNTLFIRLRKESVTSDFYGIHLTESKMCVNLNELVSSCLYFLELNYTQNPIYR